MTSSEEDNLKDTPIMRSISQVLPQQSLTQEGFSDESWNVALNFIHTLWTARDVLDQYCYRSAVKPWKSFDFASDLIRHVGDVHELSDDYSNFINCLRPKFTSKLEEAHNEYKQFGFSSLGSDGESFKSFISHLASRQSRHPQACAKSII